MEKKDISFERSKSRSAYNTDTLYRSPPRCVDSRSRSLFQSLETLLPCLERFLSVTGFSLERLKETFLANNRVHQESSISDGIDPSFEQICDAMQRENFSSFSFFLFSFNEDNFKDTLEENVNKSRMNMFRVYFPIIFITFRFIL